MLVAEIDGGDLAVIIGGCVAAVGVISTPTGLLMRAVFKRMDRQSEALEQVNKAVNHQADGEPTLVQRVKDLEERQIRHETNGVRRHTELTDAVGSVATEVRKLSARITKVEHRDDDTPAERRKAARTANTTTNRGRTR